jgi:hypothetical protein
MSKIKIGIDINEILRARWLQFDRFYVQEFGENGVPEQPYVYDYYNTYNWSSIEEIRKELKEPDEIPDDINPLFYQTDNNGETKADSFLFKKNEVIKMTSKEVFDRFMFQDFTFEIFGSAPIMYKGLDVQINNFLSKYEKNVEFILYSIENKFSIPATLFFLSKMPSRFNNYKFINKSNDIWKDVNVLITTDPEILKNRIPWGKKIIKVKRPYNENIKVKSLEILQLMDLFNNKEFEKIIKYKK